MLPRPLTRAFSPAFIRGSRVNAGGRYIARGPELVTNGDFSAGATGWEPGTGWAITGGQLVATAAAQDTATRSTGDIVVAGKRYDIQLTCTAFTAGGWKLLLEGGVNVFGDMVAAGKFRATALATVTGSIYVWTNSALTASFDNISVRELIGR